MRVLVFGDSITQGYWDADGGWVDRLRKQYDEQQIQDLEHNDEPTIFNLGISADNSDNVLKRIEAETIARTRPSGLPIVIVQIGINDCSRTGETVQVELESYKRNLKTIIEKTKPLSAKLIFVGLSACDESKTLPVVWGNHYYDNTAIKQYENAMRAVAGEHGITFIPIFDTFTEALKAGKQLLPDGLHPNNEGHQFIYEIVKSKLMELLK